jgi:hypothetical protein
MPDWSYTATRGEEYAKFQRTGLRSYLVEMLLWTANWYPLVYHAETPRTLKKTAKALLSCHVV